jgi:N-methylhydantoinase A
MEEGYGTDQVITAYEMLARYGGQAWELRVPITVRRINSEEDLKALITTFEEEYIRVYGEIAMVPRGGIEIITLALRSEVELAKPVIAKEKFAGEDPFPALKGTREVYFGGKWQETAIYDMNKLGVGNNLKGPAIVETWNTTFVVPPGFDVTKDEYRNLIMVEM